MSVVDVIIHVLMGILEMTVLRHQIHVQLNRVTQRQRIQYELLQVQIKYGKKQTQILPVIMPVRIDILEVIVL
jgi:hypothetical protein